MTSRGYTDCLPTLNESDYEALKSDIEQRGVLIAVEQDEHGNLLDGYHRLRVCEELGIDPPRVVRAGLTEEQKRSHARALNLARRHLTQEQRRELIADELRDNPRRSNRQVAASLGVSHVTVGSLRDELESNGQIDQCSTVETSDGREYPARKTHLYVDGQREAEKAQELLAEVSEPPDKRLELKRLERIAREQPSDNGEQPAPEPTGDVRFEHSSLTALDIEDGSVDLILTDPPYGSDHLSVWNDLADFALCALKPGKLLVAYSGQYHLPVVIDALRTRLEYVWMGVVVTPGQHNQVKQRHIRSAAKPLLFFARPPYEAGPWFDDAYVSEERSKEHHEWEQSLGAVRYYVERLTQPGELVVDPFLGSGTTALAARDLGRSFVGCDIDELAIRKAKERLAA